LCEYGGYSWSVIRTSFSWIQGSKASNSRLKSKLANFSDVKLCVVQGDVIYVINCYLRCDLNPDCCWLPYTITWQIKHNMAFETTCLSN